MKHQPGSVLVVDGTGEPRPVPLSGDLTINAKGGVTASADFCRRLELTSGGGTVEGDKTITGGSGGLAHTLELVAGKGITLTGEGPTGRIVLSAEKEDRGALRCVESTIRYTDPCFDLGLAPDSTKASILDVSIPSRAIIEAVTVDTVHPFQSLDGVLPLRMWFRMCDTVIATCGHYEERGVLKSADAGDVLRARMVSIARTHLLTEHEECPDIVIRGVTNHRGSQTRLFAGECRISFFFRML